MYSYISSHQYYKDDIDASPSVTYNSRTHAIRFSGSIPTFTYDRLYGTEEDQKQELRKRFPGKHIIIVNQ